MEKIKKPRKRATKKSIALGLLQSLQEAVILEEAFQNYEATITDLPEINFTFKEKSSQLLGYVNSGSIFIGDAAYFTADPQAYPEGVVLETPDNPFKNWGEYSDKHSNDHNLDLPGSFNGDLPGRGVVIQTNMLGGSFTVHREEDPETGRLLSLLVKFRD